MAARLRETPGGAVAARPLALALCAVTGATGLVNEVAWQRALSALIGSDGVATAAVLATFLGGLAVGYAAFGAVARRGPSAARLLRVYAAAEAAIGLWALAFPAQFSALWALATSPRLVGAGGSALAGPLLDVALAALLVGPPTLAMGATLPLLTQALARDPEDAARLHARVYGANAGGGFAGALAAGLVALPQLGIAGTLRATGLANLAVAVAFLALARGGSGRRAVPAPPSSDTGVRTPLGAYATAAALVGFATITIQTVWIRVGGLAFGASDLTFAVVVATFVLCLAVGSLAVGAWPRALPRAAAVACPAVVAVLLAALHPFLQYAPYAAHRIRLWAGQGDAAFLRFEVGAALLVIAVGLVPLGLAGASLPLVFAALRRRMDDLGGAVGRLYAWNTLGSVLGALVGGHALLRWLDLHHVHRIAIAALAVAGGLLAWRETRLPRLLPGALLAAALVGLASLPPWDPVQLSTGYLRLRTASAASYEGPLALAREHSGRVVFAADDPVTTVLVTDHDVEGGGSSRALHTQGKSDGSLVPDYPTMALAGLVPCILARECRSAFVIGLGTGTSVGELAELDSVERVVVAEISPAVIEALPLFDHGNRAASLSPKVEILAEDAHRALLARSEAFDVIVSEPSHPWAAGVERLYALEFLRAARARLAPGGVYAQWMHAYEMDDATLALVLRTYVAAFGRVSVWFANGPDLLLLGFGDGEAASLETVTRRARRPDLRAGLERAGSPTLSSLLAHELVPVGVATAEALPGPVHTLLHPRLGHAAGRAFFHDDRARLPRFLSETARERAAREGLVARRRLRDDRDFEAWVDETCRSRAFECATRIAAWRHARPASHRPERALERWAPDLPEQLLPERVDLLVALYDGGLPGLDAEDARRVTEHFHAYYDHTRPFRRRALLETWEGCVGDGCEAGLREARARLDGPVAWIGPASDRSAKPDGTRDAADGDAP